MNEEFSEKDILLGLQDALKELIEMGWIKPNEHLSGSSIGRSIFEHILKERNDRKKSDEIRTCLELMQKHFPDDFQAKLEKKTNPTP